MSTTSDAALSDVTSCTSTSEDEMSRKNSSSIEPPAATSAEGNNNSLPKEISYAELELLKKLEEQNRYV